MAIQIEKLLKFKIPSVQQELTARDIAFYAISIGLGRDPLNQQQLRFVDPVPEMDIMPSMVLVMAHPGFWMAHPESGIDPKAVLHAAQGFQILAPIPTMGLVASQSRITEVVDKGEGKPALIFTETDLSDEEGHVFARLERTTFIRNGGGFGGSSGSAAETVKVPTTLPDYVVELETGPEQALLYRLNGDLNPLHSNPELARKLGFERPILHGLCTMGVVTHALLSTRNYKSNALRQVKLRFAKPVYPGEVIRTEIWRDGSFRALVPVRDVVVIDGGYADFSVSGGSVSDD